MGRYFEITVKSELTKRMVDPSKPTEGILLVYVNLTKVMK